MSPIFQIENLACQYRPGKVVLQIPRLDIPAGELVFVLGISGIGKSTFLETLGLMNNTIAPDTGARIRFKSASGKESDLSEIWRQPNDVVSGFRNESFSFIFQNTNLMPNFTAGENMGIGLLIRGNSLAAARSRILELMDELNLPAEIFEKKITELSGGQRQRLAFARAVTSSFEVLFGDEPTGNLDKYTAIRLLEILKNILSQERKTGIIVSHDQELAVRFADRIIVLTPASETADTHEPTRGIARPADILHRSPDGNTWLDGNDQPVPDVFGFLHQRIGIHLN